MRAVGLFTHGGPEALQVVELPGVHAGPDRRGSASMQRRSTQPTSGSATARAPNSRRLIRHLTCQEWRRRASSMRLGAAFPTNSRLATPSWRSWCRKAAMVRIASKLCWMPDRSYAPAGKTHPEACSLPVNGLTARQSLDLLKLSPGQVIAVTGAAGAYGGYVVQLAKAEGLTVIADASEKDEKLVASLGADIVVRRGDDVASRFEDISLKESMGSRTERCSMSLSSRRFATAAPSCPSADSRASRSGISTSWPPLCVPLRRSLRSSIGFVEPDRGCGCPLAVSAPGIFGHFRSSQV